MSTPDSKISLAEKLAILAPKIMGSFHFATRHHQQSSQITMRQFQALVVLMAHEKLTLSEIGEKLGLAASSCTELINRMIQQEFVTKTSGKNDRRQVYLVLTEDGKSVIKARQRQMTQFFQSFLEPFKDKDKERFVAHFDEIYQLIQKYYHTPLS